MTTSTATKAEPGVQSGTTLYRRISVAMFFAGFATFSLLYCVQPLLPSFANHYHITPANSSLALSISTGFLAFSILLSSAFSEALGRRGLMTASMIGASILNIVAALATSWHWLLVARALEGILLGGVPAVAMAYLAEEIAPRGFGKIMGLYVGGTAFGGMMGRVGMGSLIEWFNWQWALAIIGIIDLIAAIAFYFLLPPSKNFVAVHGINIHHHIRAWVGHIGSIRLLYIYLFIALVFGDFVAILNYTGFRMSGAPFFLSPTEVGFIFLSYVSGIIVSPIAGNLTNKYHRSSLLFISVAILALGLVLTLTNSLFWFIVGIICVTIGFFSAHAVASSWVGRIAVGAKGHATALYLLFYYMGSSFIGAFGGWFWFHGGWDMVIAFTGTLVIIAFGFCYLLRRRELA
ncbi:MFS transporter, YNFM family, putative membrane transport protein [Bartonella apihabitans]|uniref:MFS transporter, YNFM family, putative membrane transport protein n=1 Tax=Bartonella apihabitans TaxID=2750929 RepID=A0A1U9MA08_9HYPH|nr:MFS transporter [Bartonella apihabitans]AQT42144.1 MFS transporter, YNFM family, putative membrane transport protein [Bartonella apihabitans]